MEWEVEYTDQFEDWWDDLDADQQEDLARRVEHLQQHGPQTRRPVVGEITGSTYDPKMKELICDTKRAHLRVLFVFDPRQTAILLLGGDKTGSWKSWYRQAIPQADRLYAEHLEEIEEGAA